MLPEVRATGLLTEQVGDETIVYDSNSKEVHRLSPIAAAVFALCDGRTSADRIAELAQERLGEPLSAGQVETAVAQLQERSLLEAPAVLVREGISRREMMRKSALTGAAVAAIPLISSMAAPTAAMAISNIPTGCTGCGKNSDCASNHCCQQVPGKQCNQTCCVGANNSCHLVNDACVPPNCACTVVLAGCDNIVCPPNTARCCTSS